MDEREHAIKEGEMIAAEEAYFDCRPHIEKTLHRRIFDAGFNRGWDSQRTKPRSSTLSDAQISVIAESMPGGLPGYCKGWGWTQFARAIEEANGISS